MIPQDDPAKRSFTSIQSCSVPSTSSFQADPLGFDQAFDTILFSEGDGLGSIDDLEAVPPHNAGSLRRCLVCLQIGAVLPRLQRILISKGPMSRAGP